MLDQSDLDNVFRALADPGRRVMLERLTRGVFGLWLLAVARTPFGGGNGSRAGSGLNLLRIAFSVRMRCEKGYGSF